MNPAEALQKKLEEAGITPDLQIKWDRLAAQLAAFPSIVVAYSGGVDSSLLAYAAAQVLGKRMVAVTVTSPIEAAETLQKAADFAAAQGIPYDTIPFDPLQDPAFAANLPERCYICKTHILALMAQYAAQHRYQVVVEGQNADDEMDYRPGRKAVTESGAFSPLAEAGLTKAEIRRLAQALALPVWDQPSSPCLATRIPYGTPLTAVALEQIARAEDYLHQKGFKVVRVRHHGSLARIETGPEQMQAALELRAEIMAYFRQIGFNYVALDLQGYRLGSMNEGLSS